MTRPPCPVAAFTPGPRHQHDFQPETRPVLRSVTVLRWNQLDNKQRLMDAPSSWGSCVEFSLWRQGKVCGKAKRSSDCEISSRTRSTGATSPGELPPNDWGSALRCSLAGYKESYRSLPTSGSRDLRHSSTCPNTRSKTCCDRNVARGNRTLKRSSG